MEVDSLLQHQCTKDPHEDHERGLLIPLLLSEISTRLYWPNLPIRFIYCQQGTSIAKLLTLATTMWCLLLPVDAVELYNKGSEMLSDLPEAAQPGQCGARI